MVSRAYPAGNAPPEVQSALAQAWDLAARAQPPRGRGREPHAQARGARAPRPRAARRDRPQGRGARARGVARAARGRGRAARTCEKVRGELAAAEKVARPGARRLADGARPRQGTLARSIFERAGAAAAHGRGQARAARPHESRRPPARTHTRATCAARSKSSAPSSRATPRRSRRTSPRAARRSPRARARASPSRRRSARCRTLLLGHLAASPSAATS